MSLELPSKMKCPPAKSFKVETKMANVSVEETAASSSTSRAASMKETDVSTTKRSPQIQESGRIDFQLGKPNPDFYIATNQVQLPPGAAVARSEDGRRAQCLLCGRISSWNEWRIRAHFVGGDPHVKVCPIPVATGAAHDGVEEKTSTVLRESAPYHRSWNFSPLEGYRAARPTSKSPWLGNIAFNEEGRAQCLLCGRTSTKNMARLRAHFYGGDRHVAVCPSVNEGRFSLDGSPRSDISSLQSSEGEISSACMSSPSKRLKLQAEARNRVDAAVDAFAISNAGSAALVASEEFAKLVRALSGIEDWTYD